MSPKSPKLNTHAQQKPAAPKKGGKAQGKKGSQAAKAKKPLSYSMSSALGAAIRRA